MSTLETSPEDRSLEQESDRGHSVGEELTLLPLLEALLYASIEPLLPDELEAALPQYDGDAIMRGVDLLERQLRAGDRGLRLERIAGGYRLSTKPDLAPTLRALFRFRNQKRLTPATLDVLAIVAYSQPVTAPEIEEIRGSDPTYALKVLAERRLIRMMGRKKVVGRPILYGTTRDFLLHFGLNSVEDLPPIQGYGTRVLPAQARMFGSDDLEIEPLEGELPEAPAIQLDSIPIDPIEIGAGQRSLASEGDPDRSERTIPLWSEPPGPAPEAL